MLVTKPPKSLEQELWDRAKRYQRAVNMSADAPGRITLEEAFREVVKAHERTGKGVLLRRKHG